MHSLVPRAVRLGFHWTPASELRRLPWIYDLEEGLRQPDRTTVEARGSRSPPPASGGGAAGVHPHRQKTTPLF